MHKLSHWPINKSIKNELKKIVTKNYISVEVKSKKWKLNCGLRAGGTYPLYLIYVKKLTKFLFA